MSKTFDKMDHKARQALRPIQRPLTKAMNHQLNTVDVFGLSVRLSS